MSGLNLSEMMSIINYNKDDNMRRILIMAVFMSAFIAITACAQKKNSAKQRRMETKTLVVYFSATGTTESVAKKLVAVASQIRSIC